MALSFVFVFVFKVTCNVMCFAHAIIADLDFFKPVYRSALTSLIRELDFFKLTYSAINYLFFGSFCFCVPIYVCKKDSVRNFLLIYQLSV